MGCVVVTQRPPYIGCITFLTHPLEVRREHDVRLAATTHFDGGLIARRVAIDLGAQIRGRSDGMACKLAGQPGYGAVEPVWICAKLSD
jgi:hypothetical protein